MSKKTIYISPQCTCVDLSTEAVICQASPVTLSALYLESLDVSSETVMDPEVW